MPKEMTESRYRYMLDEIAYHVGMLRYLTKTVREAGWSYPLSIDPNSEESEVHLMPKTHFEDLKHISGHTSKTSRGMERSFTIGATKFFTVLDWEHEWREGKNEITD